MDFTFTQEHTDIAGAVRDLLAAATAAGRLRELQDDGKARRRSWQALAGQGALGLLIPAEHDGLDLGWVPTALVLEEIGYSGMPGPFVDSIAVAPTLLAAAGTPEAGRLLARLSEGDAVVGVRLGAGDAFACRDDLDVVLCPSGDRLACLPPEELPTAEIASLDEGMPLSRLTGEVDAGECLATHLPAAAVAAARDAGALATAAVLLGVTRRLLDLTREYVGTREQFGRVIGGFQAVQHQLVDANVRAAFAVPLVHRAAFSMEQALPERTWDVSKAKRAAALAAHGAARTALQLHGAIGYTWEYDLSVWLKREQTMSALYGNQAWHLRRLAEHMLERQSS